VRGVHKDGHVRYLSGSRDCRNGMLPSEGLALLHFYSRVFVQLLNNFYPRSPGININTFRRLSIRRL
jgi:hypothetical protein